MELNRWKQLLVPPFYWISYFLQHLLVPCCMRFRFYMLRHIACKKNLWNAIAARISQSILALYQFYFASINKSTVNYLFAMRLLLLLLP